MQREQYLILVLFICWPYLRGGGGPNFSSFSLPCIRIIPQHLTLFEPRCVVASPASLCASDSPAGLWLSNHLGEREERLQSRRNKSTALLQDAFGIEKFKCLSVYFFHIKLQICNVLFHNVSPMIHRIGSAAFKFRRAAREARLGIRDPSIQTCNMQKKERVMFDMKTLNDWCASFKRCAVFCSSPLSHDIQKHSSVTHRHTTERLHH